ncbi:MAG TPA: DMT family transporter [Steroidobacteraceae bacterium]|nr:DMT family transporter [Steroidobacteraceae bacterium]
MSSTPDSAPTVGASSPVQATATQSWLTPVELTVLGAIWGASFLFMRVSAKDFGPLVLVEIRLALGALILLPFLWRARAQFSGALWLRLAGIAAINSAIPFTFFAWGAERAPAGIGAITNAMAVPFTAMVAFLFFHEQIGGRRAAGLLLGFVGVVVLASGRTNGGTTVWPAALAGATAALCYGFGGNMLKRYLIGVPASAVASASLICASVLVAPLAIATWPHQPIRAISWVSAALLGVLCTGLAYVLHFRLIHRIGAPRAATVTYIIPLFGVVWAWLLLDEPLTPSMALAGALILSGVALSQTKPKGAS